MVISPGEREAGWLLLHFATEPLRASPGPGLPQQLSTQSPGQIWCPQSSQLRSIPAVSGQPSGRESWHAESGTLTRRHQQWKDWIIWNLHLRDRNLSSQDLRTFEMLLYSSSQQPDTKTWSKPNLGARLGQEFELLEWGVHRSRFRASCNCFSSHAKSNGKCVPWSQAAWVQTQPLTLFLCLRFLISKVGLIRTSITVLRVKFKD